MPRFGSLGKFFGRTVSEGAAFAAGAAVAPVLRPELRLLENQSWARAAFVPLSAGEAAGIVAEDVAKLEWGITEASYTGVNEQRFRDLYGEALNAPDVATLRTMWRRGDITAADFEHGLRKAKLEGRWDAAERALKTDRLSPQQVALGIVRSVLRDPGLLAAQLDTSDSNVPRYEPLDLDPLAEAAAGGIDRERLRGMVGEIGLPMSAQQAASALFRQIITRGAYNQAILEGDTRPEWADAILEQSRQIASAADYVNARLRGWISDDEMYSGTERHGMSREDTRLLYLIHGRPAAPGQMATASFRGIDGPDGRPMDEPQFLKGITESDIRPEWGPMLWESRYHYPPLFQLSRLVQSGAIDVPTAVEWAHKSGLAPEVVAALEKSWQSGGSSANREATAADLLTLYDGGRATEPETLAALTDLGYSAADAQHKVDVVGARRVASAKGTTITDIHAKYKKGAIDAEVAVSSIEQLGVPAWAADGIVQAWAFGVGAVEPTQ